MPGPREPEITPRIIFTIRRPYPGLTRRTPRRRDRTVENSRAGIEVTESACRLNVTTKETGGDLIHSDSKQKYEVILSPRESLHDSGTTPAMEAPAVVFA